MSAALNLSLPAAASRLGITPSGANANASGFTLQSTTDLASPDWISNLPVPVVVNGQNTVTNPISGGK